MILCSTSRAEVFDDFSNRRDNKCSLLDSSTLAQLTENISIKRIIYTKPFLLQIGSANQDFRRFALNLLPKYSEK